MGSINVDCSIILKATNPHLFPAGRAHTLPGCSSSREKVFSVPCWLCFLALNTCSGLGCKYLSLGTYHHFWTGSLSCLSHYWGAFQCAIQSGNAPVGKSPPAIQYQMECLWKTNKKYSYLPSPTLWCHQHAGKGRDTEKDPQTSQLEGACLILHPLLSNCVFSPTATWTVLGSRVLNTESHLILAYEMHHTHHETQEE